MADIKDQRYVEEKRVAFYGRGTAQANCLTPEGMSYKIAD